MLAKKYSDSVSAARLAPERFPQGVATTRTLSASLYLISGFGRNILLA
jgi:hypothetical protein